MKKGKKTIRFLALFLSVMFILGLAACGKGKGQDGSDQSGVIKLGDYTVEIKDANLTKDDDGKDSIVLTLIYSNNSKKANSFLWSVSTQAFQDGIGLESNDSNIFTNLDDFTSLFDDHMTDIQPGKSLELKMSYALNDKESPVEISFSGFLSDKENKVTYEPSKLEFVELNVGDSEDEEEAGGRDETGGLTEAEAVEAIEGQEIEIHDYLIKYKGAFLTKDDNDQDTLIVSLDYTNGSETEDSFTWTISNAAVQDENPLKENSENIVVNPEDGTTLFDEQFNYIEPGKTVEVHLAYTLDNTEDPVKVTLADVAEDYGKVLTLNLTTLEFQKISK